MRAHHEIEKTGKGFGKVGPHCQTPPRYARLLDLADSCSHPWTIIPSRLQTYWGSKWRFKIFDGFYTHPKDPETGLTVDVAKRFAHLQERLGKAAEVCERVAKRSRSLSL
jgi:hypothetical protein